MARPKTITDQGVLDAAIAIMQERGPDALTFAAVGKTVGLSPATLVQRFGTKQTMIRAALSQLWDKLDALTAHADTVCADSPEGAVALLMQLSVSAPEIEDYVQGLSLLREDMRDPVLRRRGAAWGKTLAAALGRRLTRDPDRQNRLGRLMAAQWQGAQLWWAFERDTAPAEDIENDLRAFCDLIADRPG
ncbi:TetR/AcrR family transcriptional regulator [Pelagibacterium xiamenense]|uniref:TetR/AcrR family transcriptional regulator n=1 Tax=Pelagibacterium xiamenense TaxID=2901140 RepID=UPI001E42CF18|nr:TetR/AcrR family transcriptional regulator [Pelagibacterium xiamenense]MCD7060966.1 TetR/AcrR family transcriptional regulator [Pelagibacterium xiamenense]